MHHAAVRVIEAQPERLTRVLDALARWSESERIESPKLQAWRRIVGERQWEVMLDVSDAGDELRRGSPLPFALDADERAAILALFAR
jgi:hypothetical protein